jgi:hypothetical protein
LFLPLLFSSLLSFFPSTSFISDSSFDSSLLQSGFLLPFSVIFDTTEQLPQADESMLPTEGSAKNIDSASKSRGSSAVTKQESRQLLGELCVDKDYLEKLLKHPGRYHSRHV